MQIKSLVKLAGESKMSGKNHEQGQAISKQDSQKGL